LKKKLYKQYTNLNFTIIEIGKNKNPLAKRDLNAKSIKFDKNKIYGAVIPDGIFIIDIDTKNDKVGLESFERLCEDIENLQDIRPTIKTGSGGLHYYFKTNLHFRTTNKEYPDIDFLTSKADKRVHNPFVVAGGQSLENGDYTVLNEGKLYINDNYDEQFMQVLEQQKEPSNEDILEDDTISFNDIKKNSHDKLSLKKVYQLLQLVDGSSYENWMKICAILKRENNSKEMRNLFIDFSKNQDGFVSEIDVITKWDNIGNYHGDSAGIGSLLEEALTNKTNHIIDDLERLEDDIELEDIKKTLTDMQEYPYITKSELVAKISHKVNILVKENNIPLGLKDVREFVVNCTKKPRHVAKEEYLKEEEERIEAGEAPRDAFLNEIVYIDKEKQSKYGYKYKTYNDISLEALLYKEFQMLNDGWKANNGFGDKEKVTPKNCVIKNLIPLADVSAYNSATSERIFKNMQGNDTFNLFNPQTVPQEADSISKEGLELIKFLIEHYKRLYSEDEVKTMLDYWAYIAQNPSKRVSWVMVMQGSHGIGKTLICELVATHVVGRANSTIVDPNQVTSNFNDWASGSSFCVMDEIRVEGQSRYSVLNKLKPLITNQYISLNRKGQVGVTVINNITYVIVTNHKDAIPSSATHNDSRRWYRMFSKIESDEDYKKMVRDLGYKSNSEYIKPIIKLLNSKAYGSEFKKWLLERDVSKFNPNERPATIEADKISVELEIEKHSMNVSVINFIQKAYSDDSVISLKELYDRIKGSSVLDKANPIDFDDDETPRYADMSKILNRIGYLKSKRISRKFGNKRYQFQIYTKDVHSSNLEVKIKKYVKKYIRPLFESERD